MNKETASAHVEGGMAVPISEDEISSVGVHQHNVTGTVQLLLDNETVLLPTPSPDPKGIHFWSSEAWCDVAAG
jgi:hypothetical protein